MHTMHKTLYWPDNCWIRKFFNSTSRKQLFTPVILVFPPYQNLDRKAPSAQKTSLHKKSRRVEEWGGGVGGSSGRQKNRSLGIFDFYFLDTILSCFLLVNS